MSSRDQEHQVEKSDGGSNEINSKPDAWLDGLRVRSYMDIEWIKSMKNMELREDDIWIVTYPKFGTTWTQQIVRLILNRGKEDGLTIEYAVPWVEAFGEIPGIRTYRMDIDKMTSPRAFKSHFPYQMMPFGLPNATPGKYISVIRNPKDVAVSFYYHHLSSPIHPHYEWDEFFETFMKGDVYWGNYFDHVLSWWAHKDDDNVLILTYEDMKKDLSSAVAKIAKFIRQDISQDLVDEIAHKTTFDNMKRDSMALNYEQRHGYQKPFVTGFLRKGAIGDWKNHFTPKQAARLDAVYDERMKGTGIETYIYESCIKWHH